MSTWAVLAALLGWATVVEPDTVSASRAASVDADALGPNLRSLSPNSASSFSAMTRKSIYTAVTLDSETQDAPFILP